MIIQPTFNIPPDIEAGLGAGDLIRYGGVVRDRMGSIVKHLKEVPGPVGSQETAGRGAASVKRPWGLITVTGIGLLAVGVAAIVASRKREEAGKPEVAECVENYNVSLRAYLEAAREGSLNASIIGQLVSDLNAVEAQFSSEDTAASLSAGQPEKLVKLVADYTTKLAEANSVELTGLQGQELASGNDAVVDLRRHLDIQKQILIGQRNQLPGTNTSASTA